MMTKNLSYFIGLSFICIPIIIIVFLRIKTLHIFELTWYFVIVISLFLIFLAIVTFLILIILNICIKLGLKDLQRIKNNIDKVL